MEAWGFSPTKKIAKGIGLQPWRRGLASAPEKVHRRFFAFRLLRMLTCQRVQGAR